MVHHAVRRWIPALGRVALFVAVVVSLGLPASSADARRRSRGPATTRAPTLTWWVRAWMWEVVDVEAWARFLAAARPGALGSFGQSVGTPYEGALINPVELPDAPAYFRRNRKRVYGTTQMVGHLRHVLGSVSAKHPSMHRLAVGDLSAPGGGNLGGHRSHQSGRDVDLGFYFRRRPGIYPFRFVKPSRENLHYRATWDLLVALADTASKPGGVDYILLDYRVQKMLHAWAVHEGVPADTIDRVLQYPRGRRSKHGIVRHYPRHANHLHVRFKCPPDDLLCI